MVRGATDKEANDIQARLPVAGDMERHFRSSARKEKQKWTIEKPKLDNARRLRGIYFIDPADGQRDGVFKANTASLSCTATKEEVGTRHQGNFL